ncbi:hypothetical protein Taro_037355 [Colocasia esculenta]|uniref:Uncharacterized protein n=1 Tax=Colocasia esculenta TaxID=4460 RepID=A0A843WKK6_COLES|nr:hypothetical protein [Colocasia esculenta]
MNLTSGENQSGSAVNEKGDVRTDQGIPISSDLGSSHADLELGALARPISPDGVNGQIRWQPRSPQLCRSNGTQSGGNLDNSQRDWRLVQLTHNMP